MTEGLDPGELLARADACAQRAAQGSAQRDRAALAAARDAVAEAIAALDALLACIPQGQTTLADSAFRTAAGRAVRERDPARFQRGALAARRAELSALGQTLRRQLGEQADPALHARSAALADTLVEAMRRPSAPPSLRAVRFTATDDARYPYAAEIDGARWTLRINEFPEDPSLYSLLVDGVVVEELMDWPAAWQRPDR